MSTMTLGAMRVEEAIRAARERGASDAHLAADHLPVMRIEGELVAGDGAKVAAAELDAFLREHLDSSAHDALAGRGQVDIALQGTNLGSLRLHVFRALGGVRIAVRLFPAAIPRLETLDLPYTIERLALRRNGLVLVVGPTGSGKTTLLASMIDLLNRAHPRHIVTFEEPIEYRHCSDRCVIAQCEISRDGGDLAGAICGVLRADPDVIVIGELRDVASIRNALGAAETGHLVFASLHTIGAAQALERIIDAFPVDGREHIRIQVAQTLAGVIALRLVTRARGVGRRAATEILVASDAVRNLIREGKIHQLQSAMQTGRASGMQTLEMHLAVLVERGEITREIADTCLEADCPARPASKQ